MKNLTNDESMIETLAKSSHEAWLKEKLAEGYKYSAINDEPRKLNSHLVNWVELSDEHKELDKSHIREQLEKLNELGFKPESVSEMVSGLADKEQFSNVIKQLGICGYALVPVK
jgi:hypothetical protein